MPIQKLSKGLIVVALVIAALGFLDASYLAAEHYLNRIPPCTIVQGCETVLTSTYATFAGIPVALFGALFYLTAFFILFFYLETGARKLLLAFLLCVSAAFLATLGFVYIQLFVLHAICLYCMGSAATSTLLFIIACMFFIKEKSAGEIST